MPLTEEQAQRIRKFTIDAVTDVKIIPIGGLSTLRNDREWGAKNFQLLVTATEELLTRRRSAAAADAQEGLAQVVATSLMKGSDYVWRATQRAYQAVATENPELATEIRGVIERAKSMLLVDFSQDPSSQQTQ